MDKKYLEIKIGDYLYFDKIFSEKDFHEFSKLSNDKNLLHHDKEYSGRTGFSEPILPVHLTSLPLSSIVGMGFPGKEALYLESNIKALKPVFYGDKLTYSARITHKIDAKRALKIKVIAFKGIQVVLNADIVAKVREDNGVTNSFCQDDYEIRNDKSKKIFVIGASGEIGSALCIQLIKNGYDLVINYRNKNESIEKIEQTSISFGRELNQLVGSLSDLKVLKKIGHFLDRDSDLTNIIYCASPPVNANLSEQMAINFIGLKSLANSSIPNMLRKQSGHFIYIGSSAIEHNPEGWDDYVASKAAATNYLYGLNKRYGKYNLKFSKGLFDNDEPYLIPQQVAESIINFFQSTDNFSPYVSMNTYGTKFGSYGFNYKNQETSSLDNTDDAEKLLDSDQYETLDQKIRYFFGLGEDYDINSILDLKLVPNWDSMKHIEFILYLEKEFGKNFSSTHLDDTLSIGQIRKIIFED